LMDTAARIMRKTIKKRIAGEIPAIRVSSFKIYYPENGRPRPWPWRNAPSRGRNFAPRVCPWGSISIRILMKAFAQEDLIFSTPSLSIQVFVRPKRTSTYSPNFFHIHKAF
jgi:hypothetical protein